jgi:WS/DGAT/MGAT family acyltransferase
MEDVCDQIRGRLHLVPRYRQRLAHTSLDSGRPVWVDDPSFNLEYHVRHTALPAPGDRNQLLRLLSRIFSQQLDRSKPLWEIWMVEGLDETRWAFVSKVHHCMVDGVSATDLLTVLFDTERDPAPLPLHDWTAAPAPNGAQMFAEAIARGLVSPYEAIQDVLHVLEAPRQFAAQAEEALRGLVRLGGLIRRPPQSSLNGPIGPHRRWGWARAQLSDVQSVRKSLGGTVNDTVLACITHGFRQLLLSRGEPVDRVVRTLVPVSVRSSAERGTYDNRVSAMFAALPVSIEDPAERLDSIRTQMQGLKESKQAVAGEVLTSLSGFAPPMLLALGARVGTRIPQRNVNTVTTNVPGPQFPLYAAGRRLLEAFPYVPLGGHIRVGVAIFSYNGALNFGITGDYDTAPDIDVLSDGIESGMTELVNLAAKSRPRRRASRAPSAAAATGD